MKVGQAAWNFRFYLAAIPEIGLVIALLLRAKMTVIDKRVAEIREELEARRGKVQT